MKDIYQWHTWFAWFPVRTLTRWCWFRRVSRKRVGNEHKGSQGHDSWWIYSSKVMDE